MKFKMLSSFWDSDPQYFTETTAPDWLTSKYTIRGSTMDSKWFWEDHVLKLEIGQTVDTEFHVIERIE